MNRATPTKEREPYWGFDVYCWGCRKPITDSHFSTAVYVDTKDKKGWATRHGPFHKDCGDEFSKQATAAARSPDGQV